MASLVAFGKADPSSMQYEHSKGHSLPQVPCSSMHLTNMQKSCLILVRHLDFDHCRMWLPNTAMLHTTAIRHFRVTAFLIYHLLESLILHAR